MSHKFFRLFVSLTLAMSLTAINSGTQPVRAAGPWYVATTGDDNNDCLSPSTACATINGAIGKASDGDTINVATGTYTSTSSFVVNINKDITLSGGWDPAFTSHSAPSNIDGQGVRGGIAIGNTNQSTITTIEYFQVEHSCSGVFNYGTLTLQNSTITNNKNDNKVEIQIP